MNNSTVKLIKELVSIPSFVDSKTNEGVLARFLSRYIKRNYPWFTITRQKVEPGRYNLIVSDGYDPKLIFVSHLDTVKPSDKRQLIPKVRRNKLYGLGAADMKAGIAACLVALRNFKKTKGLTLIFDCDEEYYFAGIKRLLAKYSYSPKLVICPEPTGLEVINGCRGVVEIALDVIGKTARAAAPDAGINAIEKAVELITELRKKINKENDKRLGKTTVNLSSIKGGRLFNDEIIVQANAVPDIARILLDIRTTTKAKNAKRIQKIIKAIAQKMQVEVRNFKVNIDYPPYFTGKVKEIEPILKNQKISYAKNLGDSGFYEASIISNAWNCPTLTFGPKGEGHIADESVELESVEKTIQIYKSLIKLLCT